jgi:predicted nucleotide-binding protein
VTQNIFYDVAGRYPGVWQRLAEELAARLYDAASGIRTKNVVPRLFVGSSSEQLEVANQIKHDLRDEDLEVTVWNCGSIAPSTTVVDSLLGNAESADFAVFVLGADDLVLSRGSSNEAPRDNVLLEVGLYMGQLGRSRVFLFRPAAGALKIPSDLAGLTMLGFGGGLPESSPEGVVCPASTEIRRLIRSMGPR